MTTAELYRIATFNPQIIAQTLYATYRTNIQREMCRLIGYADNQILLEVLEKVQVQMKYISKDCDLSYLVFDTLRKTIITRCRDDMIVQNERINPLLRNICWFGTISEQDGLRVDILFELLTKKQRTYFLKRYYYLDTSISINKRYEWVIRRLISGKGIAAIRFNHFRVPIKEIQTEQYVEYLNTLIPMHLDRILKDSASILTKATTVPVPLLFAERQYWILSRFVPIAVILMLFLTLIFILYFI